MPNQENEPTAEQLPSDTLSHRSNRATKLHRQGNRPTHVVVPVIIPDSDKTGILTTLYANVPVRYDEHTGEALMTEEALRIIEEVRNAYHQGRDGTPDERLVQLISTVNRMPMWVRPSYVISIEPHPNYQESGKERTCVCVKDYPHGGFMIVAMPVDAVRHALWPHRSPGTSAKEETDHGD